MTRGTKIFTKINFFKFWFRTGLFIAFANFAVTCRYPESASLRTAVWKVMAHAQKPDFVFRRNGRVHLNRRRRQFSRLLAAEVCASAVVMLDTSSSKVVWRVLKKVKVKAVCVSYSTAALRHILLLPECVPSFIFRGAAHIKRRERPLLEKEGTIHGI